MHIWRRGGSEYFCYVCFPRHYCDPESSDDGRVFRCPTCSLAGFLIHSLHLQQFILAVWIKLNTNGTVKGQRRSELCENVTDTQIHLVARLSTCQRLFCLQLHPHEILQDRQKTVNLSFVKTEKGSCKYSLTLSFSLLNPPSQKLEVCVFYNPAAQIFPSVCSFSGYCWKKRRMLEADWWKLQMMRELYRLCFPIHPWKLELPGSSSPCSDSW